MTVEEKVARANAMRTGMRAAFEAARAAAPAVPSADPGVEMQIPTRHGEVRVRFLAAPGQSLPSQPLSGQPLSGQPLPDMPVQQPVLPDKKQPAQGFTANSETRETIPAGVYFNLHGGGFILGAPEDDALFCQRVNRELGLAVVNIDYLLAPEHPFPADKESTYDVVAHVVAHASEFSIDPDRIAIGGHSAGGNIATAVCMMALRSGAFRFRCQVLDYPPLDVHTSAYDKKLPQGSIPADMAAFFDSCYRTEEQSADPLCSPVCAKKEDLSGMPPAIILTAEMDSLCAEAELYAMMLVDANVEITLRRFAGALHGFSMNPQAPASMAGQNMMLEGLKRHV